jgi:putative lipoprotein
VLPEGTVLPDGAEWKVRLEDTSLADAPAVLIAEAGGVTDPTATEIPFEIAYDAATILDANTYTLQASLEDAAGTLLYVNDTAIPVLTGGAPSEGVSVPVVAVEPAASMAAEASVAPESVSSPEASPAP